MKKSWCQLQKCAKDKICVSGYLIIQNFFREYSSKKCATHWHRTGTWLGRLPRLASGVLTWTHSPLHFLEISGSAFIFPPLLFHLVRPCRREVWGGLQGASLGFPFPRTLSLVLVLVCSQSPEPATPSGAFTHTPHLVPCLTLPLALPSFSPVGMALSC